MGTCERLLRIEAPADEVWKRLVQPRNQSFRLVPVDDGHPPADAGDDEGRTRPDDALTGGHAVDRERIR